MTSHLTLGRKFGLACAAVVGFTAVLGVYSIHGIAGIDKNLQSIVVDSLPGVAAAAEVRALALQLRASAWKHIAAPDAAAMRRIDDEIADWKRQVEEGLLAYEKTITLAEDRAMFERIRLQFEPYYSGWEDARKLSLADHKQEARSRYLSAAEPSYVQLLSALDELVDWNKRNGERNAQASTGSVDRARSWIRLLLALSVIVGGLLTFWTTHGITRVLNRVIAELTESVRQLAGAASQVSSSSQSLAKGSSEQAASLEETAASTEQIKAMARRNRDTSRAAAALVRQSQQRFTQADRLLDQSVAAMGEISAHGDRISKIIRTIDEIAFQTNILALNAAVEAARAGEAGMGFAVVADEVRSLAQRCARAAKDTAALIEESIAKSNGGKMKVDQVAAAFRETTEEAAKVKTLIDEVNTGSQEQTSGIERIGSAMHQMEQVTEEMAASAEESASVSQELNAQSTALMNVVERLAALVRGGAAGGHAQQALIGTAADTPACPPSQSRAGLTTRRVALAHTAKRGSPEGRG